VAVNVVAVVAAPFLAACSDPGGALGPAPTAARLSAAVKPGVTDLIPGEYIVTFADSVRDVRGVGRALVAQAGGTMRFEYESAIRGFAARLPGAAVDGIRRNPRVARIEQDWVVDASDVQTPVPSWGLDRIDQRPNSLDDGYSYSNSGAGVNAYILDTGIRATHMDFNGRAVAGFTAIDDGNGTSDCRGHGTHVAGVIGGRRYGVAKGVTLYAVRVLGCDGKGTGSGLVAGVDWVTRNRILPAVANMSLGSASSATLQQAVQNSIAAGVFYAVAAGNASVDACTITPANVAAAMTVGASNEYGSAESYSNYGRCVDVYAPGRAVISTWHTSDSAHTGLSGTSAASPHVTGAAALVLGARPGASPTEVTNALLNDATPSALSTVAQGTPNLLLFTGFIAGPSEAPAPSSGAGPVPDQPPTARFTTNNCPRGTCAFDATGSTDDRGVARLTWDFGDGSSMTVAGDQRTTSHSFRAAGTYVSRLTVIDGGGQSSTTTRSITVKRVF
jgi:subtilisin family serine protease